MIVKLTHIATGETASFFTDENMVNFLPENEREPFLAAEALAFIEAFFPSVKISGAKSINGIADEVLTLRSFEDMKKLGVLVEPQK